MSLYTEVKRQVLESISLFLPNPETSGDPASLKWSCHGTILLPVAIGRAVKAALRSKGLSEAAPLLIPALHQSFVASFAFSPAGHLYAHLHRPALFREALSQWLPPALDSPPPVQLSQLLPPALDSPPPARLSQLLPPALNSPPPARPVLVVDYSSHGGGRGLESLGLAEARTALLVDLLVRLLRGRGHPVETVCPASPALPAPPPAAPPAGSGAPLAGSGTLPIPPAGSGGPPAPPAGSCGPPPPPAGSCGPPPPPAGLSPTNAVLSNSTDFVSSIAASQFACCQERGAEEERVHFTGAIVVDGRGFAQASGLSGRGGYDGNIGKIKVTDAAGGATPTALLACSVHVALQHGRDTAATVLHVAQQAKAFSVQQAMLLGDVAQREEQGGVAASQLLLVAGVRCSHTDPASTTVALQDLLSVREAQMRRAYLAKHGSGGPHVAEISRRVAEAVVKFELLSCSHRSPVKLELSAPGRGSELRFDGAFVLYNYARLSTLLSSFERESARGEYPALPHIQTINFSLLTEEEEWQLLCHYIVRYPVVVEEAARLKPVGAAGLHTEAGLQKLPQFLTRLSHTLSAYYSRVRILLPPEPHLLPLTFARLHLATALRGLMCHALSLLDIRPLDRL